MTDTLWYNILIYAVGALAMVFGIVAVQFKRRIAIILGNFFGQACWVGYFCLQFDWMSACTCGLSAIMLAVFARKDKWKWAASKICIMSFVVAFCALFVITFKNWLDIFPLLAGVFAVIANSQTKEKQLRQYSLLWHGFWLIISVLRVYPVAIINDVMCEISTVIGVIRYRNEE